MNGLFPQPRQEEGVSDFLSTDKNVPLSVIIPVHNVELFLDRCLRSIVCQTYKNLEIILIDDGSIDCSYEICENWKRKDNRIILYRFKDCGGAVRARQKGIELSTADYVTYVDSDDFMEPDSFEKMMRAMLQADADLCISTGMFWEEDGWQGINKDAVDVGIYEGDSVDEIRKKMILVETLPTLCNHIFKKSAHAPYQFKTDTRIRINNDVTCMLMTMMHVDKVVVIDETLYHYVKNNNSIIHTYRTEYLESNCIMYSLVKEEMLSTHREHFLQMWKEYFINKLFMNIRLECSEQNKIKLVDKMRHLNYLYQLTVLKEFIAEDSSFDLKGRDAMIWSMVKRNRTYSLWLCLKVWALIELVKNRISFSR